MSHFGQKTFLGTWYGYEGAFFGWIKSGVVQLVPMVRIDLIAAKKLAKKAQK